MENRRQLVLHLAGRILLSTALIALGVLLIGYLLGWKDPTHFSNAFFIAGAILIVLGVLSVTGGYSQRSDFGLLYSESAGQMSSTERTQRMLDDMNQRYGGFAILLVTALLLIGAAILIGNFL